MQALVPSKNYTRGQWRSERLNMDEKELFEHLTLELSDLLDFIRINKQEKGDLTKHKWVYWDRIGGNQFSFVAKMFKTMLNHPEILQLQARAHA